MLYTCPKCKDEFESFEDYVIHRLDHIEASDEKRAQERHDALIKLAETVGVNFSRGFDVLWALKEGPEPQTS